MQWESPTITINNTLQNKLIKFTKTLLELSSLLYFLYINFRYYITKKKIDTENKYKWNNPYSYKSKISKILIFILNYLQVKCYSDSKICQIINKLPIIRDCIIKLCCCTWINNYWVHIYICILKIFYNIYLQGLFSGILDKSKSLLV